MNGGFSRTAGAHWFLQRITALVLVVGLFVHFLVLHYMFDRGSGSLVFEDVRTRLSHPGWIAFDLALLACAIYHGLNGIYGIILDYNPARSGKSLAAWFLWLAGLATFFIGAWVLIPFTSGK
ncbi:MAG: hypothetical protein FJ088_13180 [Deltaproteobacteria bacterium]|nr:hypothetical protein [Deltaproteobacteria bacterium]